MSNKKHMSETKDAIKSRFNDQKERYDSLIEASLYPLVIIDVKGKITHVNQEMIKLIGLSREKLKGSDLFDHFPETDKAREISQEVFSKGLIQDHPLTVRHAEGELSNILLNGSTYKDDQNNILGAMFIARDITTQKNVVNELIDPKNTADAGNQFFDKNVGQKIKVLVAEDILLNQILMKNVLKGLGFEIDIANNGKIAIEKMENNKNKYDIVLMDLQMPEVNGFEAAEYIRNTIRSEVPIIALTSSISAVDIEKSKAVGMNDYVEKPIDEKLLYNKIKKHLKKNIQQPPSQPEAQELYKYINLDYLKQRTRNNHEMIVEMIDIYLNETPKIINKLKESRDNMDWDSLAAAAHSLIPSFTIMGINKDYELMTRKIQEYATKKEKSVEINDLVLKIEHVCFQACEELREEIKKIEQPVD